MSEWVGERVFLGGKEEVFFFLERGWEREGEGRRRRRRGRGARGRRGGMGGREARSGRGGAWAVGGWVGGQRQESSYSPVNSELTASDPLLLRERKSCPC